MKLRYTPIAGYVHSVEAVINYAGLESRITPVPTRPFDPDTDLFDDNPLGTVPTLLTDAGEALYGGPVIYEFLDGLHDRPRLYPETRAARVPMLRQVWLADGLFDAIVRVIVESWESKETQRRTMIARNWRKIAGSLDRLDLDAGSWDGLDMAQIRAVGALSFLDLKYPGLAESAVGLPGAFDWRQGRRALSAWYEKRSGDAIFRMNLPAAP